MTNLRTFKNLALAGALCALGLPTNANAQSVTLPPNGDNQKASVSQWIGLVKINVTYSSPDITGPNGEDRKGKIWGGLVPYGYTSSNFGTCTKSCPWRAGANKNTVFSVSHDVQVNGRPLAAGSYGLHMLPGKKEWTIIFSKDAKAWGSYFYDKKNDALRIKVKPKAHAYTHWLTYDFIDRQPKEATVALRWDSLEVPFTIKVNNLEQLYVAKMRDELKLTAGFDHRGWQQAALYCLQNKINLKEGLKWAQNAVSAPFIGEKNFTTLTTLASLERANGMAKTAEVTEKEALAHATATPIQVHVYGRQLLASKEPKRALKIFKANAARHKDAWPVHVGLARGYSAVGDLKEALKHARKALTQAPDPVNKKNLKQMVADLSVGKAVK